MYFRIFFVTLHDNISYHLAWHVHEGYLGEFGTQPKWRGLLGRMYMAT